MVLRMGKTVQIDDEIYEFLRQQGDFGETLSDVLRRLLSFPRTSNNGAPTDLQHLVQTMECPTCGKLVEPESTYKINSKAVYRLKCGHILQEKIEEGKVENNPLLDGKDSVSDNTRAATGTGESENALLHFVSDPALRCRNTTERYLAILGFAFREKPAKFAKVLEVSGRSRKYFASSREEIEISGASTHPHPIPGSPFWAMTNADTTQKKEMLSKALQVLEYSPEEIQASTTAIR
jgi:negative modulator of initiation of replication